MHSPLRVLQLVLNLAIGGTEKLVCDLVRRSDRRLVEPVICCLDGFGYLGEELRREGYQVHTFARKAGFDGRLIRKLSGLIQEEKIEVIHAHQYTPYFYGLLAALFRKARFAAPVPKVVFTEHGRFYPERKKLKRMVVNPILGLFTDAIVTISESTKRSLCIYENFPAHRINVVYNGIDFAQFAHEYDGAAQKQGLGLASDAQVIGIVARLDPIKNHAMLFRAFLRVLQQLPEIYLVIVGDGPEEERLKTLARSLNINDRTLFLGARKDVAELLHAFDVFALSSFSEGTSVTLLEAMGAGLPIVATNVGGNPEVIQDRETGYLVPSDNDQDMAAKLLPLLQDKQARARLGQAGQQRVQRMFSLDRMVQTYTNLYLKVSGRPPAPTQTEA